MSKCSLRIEYQHPQRQVKGGDRVQGTAHVTVNQDISCKEIRIEYFWKTHGRGDVDRGAVGSQQLISARRLTAGDYFKLPFSFIAPCDPISYRGRMLNIDHYVKLIVDVPWGTNVNIEEEFLLLPGRRPDYLPAQRGQVILERPTTPQTFGLLGKIVIGFVITLFAIGLAMIAVIIIPFLLIGSGCYFLHRHLVQSRVGEVTLQMPHRLIGPGEEFPVEISFTPKWNLLIDGVFVTIQAQEICETGSGTDKRTYRETLFEERFPLAESQKLTAGELFSLSGTCTLPTSKAYSFKAPDNQVKWTAEVRISIPRWPDWVQSETLQMVPVEFLVLEATPGVSSELPAPDPSMASATGFVSPATLPIDAEVIRQEEMLEDEVSEAVADSVAGVLDEVMQAERVTSARQAVIDLYAEQTFPAEVSVERSYSTYGQDDDRYNDGRTVIGKLVGTSHGIRLFLLPRQEEDAGRLEEGQSWKGTVRVLHWDGLYQRADLFEQ